MSQRTDDGPRALPDQWMGGAPMSPPRGDTAVLDPAVLDPAVLPRLLAGMPGHGAVGLAEHRASNGELPYTTRRERRGAGALIELVEQAGLRGRGGAAFPVARKLRAVMAASGRAPLGRRPIVLANASEGEPASGKDRLLLESLPHLVLDGGVLAARAVGADELIVCVDESAGAALRSVTRALSERERAGGDALRIGIQTVPGGLRLRPGVGAREPLQRRPGKADAHAADAFPARGAPAPDA